ncbi:MAG: MBL fold metallo-hydrolase [Ardenticatenaceae bacterium]|nr:MBL fold metallo-hydrolase [Ardenticatenaceae bacterium]
MTHFICKTCGTQFADTETAPAHCPICEDERQYIGWQGQQWTTLADLQADHHNIIKTEEPDLTGIGTQPGFAIGQRALLVQTPEGNLLWDCISLIDEATVTAVHALGGIRAVAISHPHFYSSMIEWSRAFAVPIYLHAADRQWVMRPDAAVEFWDGATKPLWSGMTLIRGGGHFEGSTVLHWPAGADGKGVLLTGDTLQVVSDRRYVSFMYSYPNLVPLPARVVRRIVAAVEPYAYDRIYSGWWDRVVVAEAKTAVSRSADRYIQALQD